MGKRSASQPAGSKGRGYRVVVRGKQREDMDAHLLVQAVMMVGEQLDAERRFLQWLFEQDHRIGGHSLDRHPVVFLGDQPFVLIDGGHLVCRLPQTVRVAVLRELGNSIQGARRYRRGEHPVWEEWIEMSEEMNRSGWERYALEALHYADESPN